MYAVTASNRQFLLWLYAEAIWRELLPTQLIFECIWPKLRLIIEVNLYYAFKHCTALHINKMRQVDGDGGS